ncbi:MAG: hypothetical protein ACI81W_001505, partial [Saprospiraceae bacterium]
DKIINFDASDLTMKEFEVKFQDKEGAVIFSEYVTTPSTFVRKYNLSEVPNGAYFLLIVDETKTCTLPIIIDTDGLKVDYEKLETVQYAALR